MKKILLHVEGLKKYYPVRKGILGSKKEYVKAVDGVDFDVYEGEVIGIVGESGCGKSTTGMLISNLINKTSGKIIFDGKDISNYDNAQMRSVRKDIQMIFQDPYASLNPRMSVREIIAEPLKIHKLTSGKEETDKRVVELLKQVGLDSYHAPRYPHEFSGGQRQRIGIARALAVEPKLVIADEPVSALDVSIQSQVLNLMKDLKEKFNLTYIFIAHDLSVVEHISDRIGVMYLGNFAEVADKKELYKNPLHPYTQALLSAVPVPDPRAKKDRIILEGSIPSALNPPSGCKFHTRCNRAMERCKVEVPKKTVINEKHYVYCHLYDEKE
ncbi:ABC transporter ATP-binding protein [Tissierella creatinophila]|uniref:Oligopeptide transport ATP-binding protein OppF n=1 Tax=Tissierella creatinophila DSM 6911 TaxID=1123403 RepID=A0A1U7M5S3_TISCR|nr:dipeptide ABC transporter ATP-binding protein [Tissierella creatinophila]OLS02657.1 oligopeptide transport ATP-binding protein OppF [Tissierella creatinophila DSM 6911]